ncbi:MFS transporter [Afifella aestuarii]|uniref:MFS transporter n=1 Tax=Afifella aestuarii TaxID=1909496 RepID=UPI00196A824C|nr:MFS transporter [Afifella aestuarii]
MTQRGHGSLAVYFGAVFAFAVTMVGTTMPTPLYPLYRGLFGFSELTITVIFAVYALGVMAALIITGRWSDQFGRRPLLFAGLAASALSDLVFWNAGGLGMILFGRVLSGISAGIFTGTATVALIELAPERIKRWGTFFATSANMGGLGLGPMFAGGLAEYLPAPLVLPYALHFLLALLACLCVWRAPETVTRPDKVRLKLQRLAVPREVRAAFVPAGIAAFAGFMVCGFFTAVAPAFLGEELGYDNHLVIGFVSGILFIASTVGQLLQSNFPSGRRLPIGCAILLTGVVVIAVGLGSEMLSAIIAGVLIAGFGHGVAFRAGLGAVADASPPDERASVVSTFFIVAYVAISFPVIGIGLAGASLGLKTASLAFSAIAAVLCCLALVLLLRGGGARPQNAFPARE